MFDYNADLSSNNPSTCGIVELDCYKRVIGFHEKVENPPGNLANAAVYVFDPDIFSVMGGDEASVKMIDFSLDVVPKMLGRIQSYKTDQFFIDIGNPVSLALAQKCWSFVK